ncbi:hypothetical protein V1525DRAFT_408135 [Lipomyces kononenkoae]|uniref:Uncharacterized protein n=1 Tax=Lipomyces kononenkoae TaxID=34357 RepID=A0ACC3SWN0_LIPKO
MAIKLFDNLKEYTLKDFFPIFIVITGYMLFRPYLMKLGGELQKREHRKASEQAKAEAAAKAMAPPKPDDQFIEESTQSVWGRNARRRQKESIKEIEKAYRRKAEMEVEYESDKEIEDLLEE